MTGVASTPNAYQGSLSVSKAAQSPKSQNHSNHHCLSPWCWAAAGVPPKIIGEIAAAITPLADEIVSHGLS